MRRIVLTLLIAVLVAASAPAADLNPPIAIWQPPTSYILPPSSLSGRTALADLSGPLPFIPVTPCRVIDTRQGSGFPAGYGPPSIAGGGTQRTFVIAGQCGVPSAAAAVSFNFAVWAPATRGDLRVFPAGGGPPPVSTLNWEANILALANAAIVPLGAGAITVMVDGPGTAVDIFVDINGYYSSSPANQNNPFSVVNTSGSATIQATNLSTTCTGACGVSAAVSSGIAVSGSSTTGGDGVYGTSADASAPGVHGFLNQPFSGSAAVFGQHQSTTGLVYGVMGSSASASGYGVYSAGNFAATGTKAFVEPHPTDPTLVVNYVALEGPEAGTYFRGTARTVNREAVIQVPESFRIVTAEEGLTVQLTPVGELTTMAVISEDVYQILVHSSRDVRFHYLVQGIRKAYRDHQPIAATLEYMPRSEDDRMPEGLSEDVQQRLISNGSYNPNGTVNMDTARRAGWTRIWDEQKVSTGRAPAPAHPTAANPERHNRNRPIVEAP